MYPVEWYDELLRCGSFGAVRLGASEAAIESALGPADDEGLIGQCRIMAFQDKHIQVSFAGGVVVHFGVYFRSHAGCYVSLEGLTLSSRTTVDEIRGWMRSKGASGSECRASDALSIELQSGVTVVFAGGVLESFQVS